MHVLHPDDDSAQVLVFLLLADEAGAAVLEPELADRGISVERIGLEARALGDVVLEQPVPAKAPF
jgi:hypothetical protein